MEQAIKSVVVIPEDYSEEVAVIFTAEVEVMNLILPHQMSEGNVNLEGAMYIISEMQDKQTSTPKLRMKY